MLETDQYWGDVSYVGVVEAQGSIIRSSSMWMVSANLLLLVQSSSFPVLDQSMLSEGTRHPIASKTTLVVAEESMARIANAVPYHSLFKGHYEC